MKKTAKRALSHTNTGQLIVRKIADKYEAAGEGSLLLLINEPDVIRERNYWQTRKSTFSLPPRENAKKVIRNGSYSILNFLEEKNIFEIREIAINSSLNHFISHNSIIFIKS